MIGPDGQVAIGLAVTMLTEVAKSLMPPEKAKALAPYLALAFSLVATTLWVLSSQVFPPFRTDVWPLFMSWLTIYCTAVGAYHTTKLAGSGGA